MRSCVNCVHRYYEEFIGATMCPGWEMAENEEDEQRCAKNCDRYKYDERTDSELIKLIDGDPEYCPSATNGDYGPSNPWDAPGMNIKDFI